MNQYQIQALQTRAGTETPYEDAQHAGYGLMTEVGEMLDTYKRHQFYKKDLDTKNLIEEVGDVLWYVSVGYHSIGKEMPVNPPLIAEKNLEDLDLPLNKLLAKLAHHAANFFSITMMYPETWQEEQLDYDLDRIYSYLTCFTRQELGVDIEEAAKANLEKLAKRYPGKTFSVEKALNRDTEHELSHIEAV
jgi:NTP pyrophosphatase (non-canonical NTP hydrolase)